MTKELQKRIITSVILLLLLIIINFSKLFVVGVFIVILFICIEFNEILSKLVGPGLIKHHRYSSHPEKLNLNFELPERYIKYFINNIKEARRLINLQN